jgi:hypothetical protein
LAAAALVRANRLARSVAESGTNSRASFKSCSKTCRLSMPVITTDVGRLSE